MSWKNILKNFEEANAISAIESAKPYTNVKDFIAGLGEGSPNPFWKIWHMSLKGELNTMDEFISYMDNHYYIRENLSESHARIIKTLLEGNLDQALRDSYWGRGNILE